MFDLLCNLKGFVSVAEVDPKGRARRLPIRADIRRALCLPGGSTLMVLHLKEDISVNSAGPLNLGHSVMLTGKSSSSAVGGIQPFGPFKEAGNTVHARGKNYQLETSINNQQLGEDNNLHGTLNLVMLRIFSVVLLLVNTSKWCLVSFCISMIFMCDL